MDGSGAAKSLAGVHDVAWPHPRPGVPVIPLLDPLLDPELPLDPLLDPELELLELLAVPPLEPELLDVAPELLPLRGPVPLLEVPPLLPMPPLPPFGLFMTGVAAPLEVPLVSTGGGVVVP